MAFDAGAVTALFDAIVSHAATLGQFEQVNAHKGLSAPGNGPWYSLWLADIQPVAAASGLASTSGRVTFEAWIGTSAVQRPTDGIDQALLTAVSAYVGALTGGFTLGGTVRNVDVLGEHGPALSAKAGYIETQGQQQRVMLVTIPVIIDDLWVQSP